MEERPKSIFRRSSEGGLYIGLLMVAVFYLFTMAGSSGMLSMLAFVGIFAVPWLEYRMLRRTYVDGHGLLTYWALATEGIFMMLCGSLILALGAYIFFRYIDPMYVTRQLYLVMDIYLSSDNPSLRDIGKTLQTMMMKGLVPRPIDMALSAGWLSAFVGAVASLGLAGIVKARKVKIDDRI